MVWVYVVQNAEGRFYVGMTTDLEERLNGVSSGNGYLRTVRALAQLRIPGETRPERQKLLIFPVDFSARRFKSIL